MRTVRMEFVLDTSAFTPEQIQPRFLLWMAMNGWAQWLKAHAISFRNLLLEHKTGVVVLGGELEYLEPMRFFDADTLVADCGVSVLKSGGIIQAELTVWTPEHKKAVAIRASCRPVQIADMSLGATAGNLPASVLAAFQPDEISAAAPVRPVPGLVEEIQSKGKLVASG